MKNSFEIRRKKPKNEAIRSRSKYYQLRQLIIFKIDKFDAYLYCNS